jgi:hypothetical protein
MRLKFIALVYTCTLRLTVQQGDAGDSCEEKIMCIQPIESDSSGEEFEDSLPEPGSGSYDYNDGYDSTHSEPEHPTLTDIQELDEEDDKESTDSQKISVIGSPTCNSEREFLLSFNYAWIPHCDCQGFYEPVQCWIKGGQLECWCSTRAGSMISNTRMLYSCTDPEQL